MCVSPHDGDEHERAAANGQRPKVGLVEMSEQIPDLLGRCLALARQPEQLGNLANGDRDGQAEDEAGDDRLGQEVGDEAHLPDAAQQEYQADDQRQRAGEYDHTPERDADDNILAHPDTLILG
jgi:hypothetical protein